MRRVPAAGGGAEEVHDREEEADQRGRRRGQEGGGLRLRRGGRGVQAAEERALGRHRDREAQREVGRRGRAAGRQGRAAGGRHHAGPLPALVRR